MPNKKYPKVKKINKTKKVKSPAKTASRKGMTQRRSSYGY